MPANTDLVRNWLKMIGALNVGAMTSDEFEWRLQVLTSALADDFPNEAFTPASAKHLASQTKYFPVYGEAFPLLQAWWREHRPTPPAIAWQPAPEPIPERTPEELQHVSTVTKRILAELSRHAIETAARYRAPDTPISRREMTRAELTEAYKRAGLRGPELPKPPIRLVIP